MRLYRAILENPVVVPIDLGAGARDLIARLLNRDPKKRLGAEVGDQGGSIFRGYGLGRGPREENRTSMGFWGRWSCHSNWNIITRRGAV
jgi:hypothetical protein